MGDLFREKDGKLSATRVVGICSAFTLIAVALVQALSPYEVTMGDRLVEALEYITIGSLFSAQFGKFASRPTKGDE